MSNLLYYLAIMVIIVWGIGYIGYNAGPLVHILLIIAFVAIILRIIKGKRTI